MLIRDIFLYLYYYSIDGFYMSSSLPNSQMLWAHENCFFFVYFIIRHWDRQVPIIQLLLSSRNNLYGWWESIILRKTPNFKDSVIYYLSSRQGITNWIIIVLYKTHMRINKTLIHVLLSFLHSYCYWFNLMRFWFIIS